MNFLRNRQSLGRASMKSFFHQTHRKTSGLCMFHYLLNLIYFVSLHLNQSKSYFVKFSQMFHPRIIVDFFQRFANNRCHKIILIRYSFLTREKISTFILRKIDYIGIESPLCVWLLLFRNSPSQLNFYKFGKE